ncbi:MAG: transposase, partial [Patescibacteria group bacterium]
ISSGWTEQEAVWGKGQENTKLGIGSARERCPFSWAEIHSDGGMEFINAHLYAYSVDTGINFSRSRAYKKNDNCLVEQKNYTHVRRLVGYLRYDTIEEMNLINDLYRGPLRLYKNFFQPVIKLISKERDGGKLHRKYDKPKTPYQRIMESPEVSKEKKRELEKIYLSLNPAELKRQIEKKTNAIYRAYQTKMNSQKVEEKIQEKKKISVRFSEVRRIPISV